ncbi:MAG: ABC transporter permease subunit, partial [Candidatus Rokuibacteriota bacterium]
MSTEFWIAQSFNGISYGALLFLLASGLSLIFGVMRIVNLAHGSYFMLGGCVGLTVALYTKSYALALLAARSSPEPRRARSRLPPRRRPRPSDRRGEGRVRGSQVPTSLSTTG